MRHEANNYAMRIRINSTISPDKLADQPQTEAKVIVVTPGQIQRRCQEGALIRNVELTKNRWQILWSLKDSGSLVNCGHPICRPFNVPDDAKLTRHHGQGFQLNPVV